MIGNFRAGLDLIFRHEGGYSNHPLDPGGATNMGITHKTLSRWIRRKATRQDVKNLTKETAKDIYYQYYWIPIKGDELPSGIDVMVFDAAVNHGVSRASRLLQHAVGAKVDGIIGPQTIARLTGYGETSILINVAAQRGMLYAGLKKVFHRGWYRRLIYTTVVAAKMT